MWSPLLCLFDIAIINPSFLGIPAHEPVRARTHARTPRIHDFDSMTGHSREQESIHFSF